MQEHCVSTVLNELFFLAVDIFSRSVHEEKKNYFKDLLLSRKKTMVVPFLVLFVKVRESATDGSGAPALVNALQPLSDVLADTRKISGTPFVHNIFNIIKYHYPIKPHRRLPYQLSPTGCMLKCTRCAGARLHHRHAGLLQASVPEAADCNFLVQTIGSKCQDPGWAVFQMLQRGELTDFYVGSADNDHFDWNISLNWILQGLKLNNFVSNSIGSNFVFFLFKSSWMRQVKLWKVTFEPFSPPKNLL